MEQPEFKLVRGTYRTPKGVKGECYVPPGEKNPPAYLSLDQAVAFAKSMKALSLVILFSDRLVEIHLPINGLYSFVDSERETVDGTKNLYPVTAMFSACDIETFAAGEDHIREIEVEAQDANKYAKYEVMRNDREPDENAPPRELWTVEGYLQKNQSEAEGREHFMGALIWMDKSRRQIAGRFLGGFGSDLASGMHDAFPQEKGKKSDEG